MVEVTVDAREPYSMRGSLAAPGAHVRVERLVAGDYVVASGCLVERKHVVDLHESLMRGRLWPQLGSLRRQSVEAYLPVEGRDLDGPIVPKRRGNRHRLSPAALAGTPAIGPRRAEALAAAFGRPRATSHSDVSRNGPRRAT